MRSPLMHALALAALLFPCICSASPLAVLKELQWQSRLILINSENPAHQPLSTLNAAQDEIEERHIHWFVFYRQQLTTNYPGPIDSGFSANTRQRHFPDDKPGVILIGKDGEIKLRSEHLDLSQIFGFIDQMPMRQAEMNSSAPSR